MSFLILTVIIKLNSGWQISYIIYVEGELQLYSVEGEFQFHSVEGEVVHESCRVQHREKF